MLDEKNEPNKHLDKEQLDRWKKTKAGPRGQAKGKVSRKERLILLSASLNVKYDWKLKKKKAIGFRPMKLIIMENYFCFYCF